MKMTVKALVFALAAGFASVHATESVAHESSDAVVAKNDALKKTEVHPNVSSEQPVAEASHDHAACCGGDEVAEQQA